MVCAAAGPAARCDEPRREEYQGLEGPDGREEGPRRCSNKAAIESRPEHKKQASGSFDLDDVAAPGSTFSEMAATGKSAAVSVIAQQAELDVSAAFEEPGSLSTGTGTRRWASRGIKANPTNIGALLGCDREQCDVSTAALQAPAAGQGNKYPVFHAPRWRHSRSKRGRGRVREQR